MRFVAPVVIAIGASVLAGQPAVGGSRAPAPPGWMPVTQLAAPASQWIYGIDFGLSVRG